MKIIRYLFKLRGLLLPAVACVILLCWSMPSLLIAKNVVALLMMPAGLVWLWLACGVPEQDIVRDSRAATTATEVRVFQSVQKALWKYLGGVTGG